MYERFSSKIEILTNLDQDLEKDGKKNDLNEFMFQFSEFFLWINMCSNMCLYSSDLKVTLRNNIYILHFLISMEGIFILQE